MPLTSWQGSVTKKIASRKSNYLLSCFAVSGITNLHPDRIDLPTMPTPSHPRPSPRRSPRIQNNSLSTPLNGDPRARTLHFGAELAIIAPVEARRTNEAVFPERGDEEEPLATGNALFSQLHTFFSSLSVTALRPINRTWENRVSVPNKAQAVARKKSFLWVKHVAKKDILRILSKNGSCPDFQK